MDKSKMIVKAEPPQQLRHGGSSSSDGAADAAISVTVDPEALDCPICYHPLQPSVYQCAAGHVVCSSCRDRLHDRSKCQVCAAATEYGRCYALERILRSLRVPCPNAARGCVVQMLLHEREGHAKECTHGNGATQVTAGSSSSTSATTVLVRHGLATVTISIGAGHGGETEVVPSKTAKKHAGEVVRMGPCGGGGGDAVKMDSRGVNRIVLVVVRHCNAVDAMAVVYERDGLEERTGMWGGQGGKRSEFRLKPDEYLTSVEGHYGQFKGKFVIRSLKFVSNTRTYGPYGKEDGVPFALPAAGGGKILGFHARSGVFLDAIGTYVKMDD
uniref:Uncharacterized protein n=1 Tax=Avena sativa TaxID=4498 RepID=A0ACD5TS60_AVESA